MLGYLLRACTRWAAYVPITAVVSIAYVCNIVKPFFTISCGLLQKLSAEIQDVVPATVSWRAGLLASGLGWLLLKEKREK